jgi:hypothetical protein
MDQEEFIEILKKNNYSYKIIGDTLVVDHFEHIDLDSVFILPENIRFKNNGYVSLGNLIALPQNVKFENNGEIYLKTGLYKHGRYRHPKSE